LTAHSHLRVLKRPSNLTLMRSDEPMLCESWLKSITNNSSLENDMSSGIQPVGHIILVLPFEVEEVSSGGIVVVRGDEVKREQMGQTEAEVVAIGNTAYSDQPAPWCKVGDRVVFARYAGTERKGKDGKTYRLINDLDVKAVLE